MPTIEQAVKAQKEVEVAVATLNLATQNASRQGLTVRYDTIAQRGIGHKTFDRIVETVTIDPSSLEN